jgi:hypothetical protein
MLLVFGLLLIVAIILAVGVVGIRSLRTFVRSLWPH